MPVLNSFGQSELFGKWNASCPLERTEGASVKFCGLCPAEKRDNSSVTIHDFEMTIGKEDIIFEMGDVTTTEKCTWDKDLHVIGFQYLQKMYSFSVLATEEDDLHILKNSDGLILLLTKDQEEHSDD